MNLRRAQLNRSRARIGNVKIAGYNIPASNVVTSLGRNDPCPCGSGLKYKRCCWQKEFAPAPEVKDHDGAVARALAWLNERHRKAFRAAFEELLDQLCSAEERRAFSSLDEETLAGVDLNLTEWLLAEGEMLVKGVRQRISTCLLGTGGPLFTVGQRDWLRQLSQRPLRLYDVTDVVPGVQITLCDALVVDSYPVVVRECSGSQTLQVGTQAGFRIMEVREHRELSGAAYPFSMLAGSGVLATLREVQARLRAETVLPKVLGLAIISGWLRQFLAPPPMPTLMDAHSGEPIHLITDHYEVQDWTTLEQALAHSQEVQGDKQDGWMRLRDCDDGQTRSVASINVGKQPGQIEVFYKTQRQADEGRQWFDTLAGESATFLIREFTNPSGSLQRPAPRKNKRATPDIDPETMAQVIEQVMRRNYANWADEPIPALGNLTPRQAIRTPAGLERVKGLLRSYEDGEERQAAEQGRREISYQFLWDALGIKR